VGVAGAGGSDEYAWRFWLTGDPTVSKYKAAKPRSRAQPAAAPRGATFHKR
jgi:DNA-3-methyladenine glycosylase